MASDILTLNAGSSSLKFSLWQMGTGTELCELFRGEIEKIGVAPHLSARESDLLRIINRGLSAEKGARLEQLQQKLRQEKITRREHEQLLRLTDELERRGAERLKALIELAAIRRTSVPKLINELGLSEATHA